MMRPTNFGPYDREERARHPRLRRWARRLTNVMIVLAIVLFAGLVLFPRVPQVDAARDSVVQTGQNAQCDLICGPPVAAKC